MSNYKKPNLQKQQERARWRAVITGSIVERRGFSRGAIEGWKARNNRHLPRIAARN